MNVRLRIRHFETIYFRSLCPKTTILFLSSINDRWSIFYKLICNFFSVGIWLAVHIKTCSTVPRCTAAYGCDYFLNSHSVLKERLLQFQRHIPCIWISTYGLRYNEFNDACSVRHPFKLLPISASDNLACFGCYRLKQAPVTMLRIYSSALW